MFQQNLINVSGQTYRKENQISSGDQAVIYEGENVNTNEKVAIRISNRMTENEYDVYQILINQKKTFIVDIKGLEQKAEQRTTVIVMELGQEDLHSFMQKNEYKQSNNLYKNLIFYQVQLLDYSDQIVSAVYELHSLQYFHRNLKPEHFIITQNSNQSIPILKLINFGLCKQKHDQNRYTQNVGTILFMAPEVISKDQYDKTSDIWSLGCIYFEMMTTHSFLQGTTQQLIDFLQTTEQKQIDQRIDQTTEMNFDEKNLLKRILQKEPSQRLTLKEIQSSLNNINNGDQWHQTYVKYVIDQKYQKLLEEEIAKYKIERNEQQKELILKKQIEIEQKNQKGLNQLEKEIKQKYDQQIQQHLKDKEKLKELQITYELETLNRLNQLKIQQEQELQKNLDLFQLQIKKDYDKQLELNIKQREIQIKAQIETEQKQIFEEEMKELKIKQLQDENKQKQMQIETKKQSIMQVMACYVEVLSKNQQIIIEKQKILEKLEQSNQIQAAQISLKVKGYLKDYEQSLLEANQVKQLLQNINDINQLYQLEKEYSEKVTQQSISLFKNIQQIDRGIENLNRFDKQIMQVQKNKEKKSEQRQQSELKTNLDQKLNYLQNQLNQMKQLANSLLQGSQEYEAVQLIQRFKKENESLTQLEFKLTLIQNQFELVKDLDLFKLEESLYELYQQCSEIEKQFQNEKVILETINQEFIKNEQIVLEYLADLLNEEEKKFHQNKSKFDSFRKEFQNLKFQQIDNCENILLEIQNLIKKIYFQKQQYCIKKQKQTFGLIKQKFEEFDIQYEQTIIKAEQLRESNKYKQFSNDLLKKLQNLKENLEYQIVKFKQKSQNIRVNQEIQYQLQQQLDIIRHNFKNYVQKYQDFENLINDNILDYQLKELKQSINDQEQFYQESDLKFKILFQQAQTIFLKIDKSQQLTNEKWSQYNDFCQKLHQFQQLSKECQLPKDIIFCEYLCKIQKFRELLRKYEEHFDKCIQHHHQNEKIGKELYVALKQDLHEFNQAKEQNLKYIHQIAENAQSNFQKLTQFLNSIFNVYKEQINFVNDSCYYESIYYSYKSYEQLMLQVDSLNSEIQNYYSQENQYDNNIFYNDKIKAINNYIIQLENTKQSFNQFDEVEFQKDRKCFSRLVLFIIVIQLYILNEIIQRQLTHQEQLERKQSVIKSQLRYHQQIKGQKEEFQIKMIKYKNDQTKFQQFLSLNEQYLSDHYIQIIQDNDNEIENQFHDIFKKDQIRLRGMIKDQDVIKNVLEYCRTLEFSRFTIQLILQRGH